VTAPRRLWESWAVVAAAAGQEQEVRAPHEMHLNARISQHPQEEGERRIWAEQEAEASPVSNLPGLHFRPYRNASEPGAAEGLLSFLGPGVAEVQRSFR